MRLNNLGATAFLSLLLLNINSDKESIPSKEKVNSVNAIYKITNFSNSYSTWLTKKESSYGRFSIEAICRLYENDGIKYEDYYLGSKVMAGNVYAKEGLIKQPTYEFQAIFSGQDCYKIVRNYLIQNELNDTVSEIKKNFDQLDVHVQNCNGTHLTTIDAVIQAALNNKSLVVRMELLDFMNKIVLEFPVKHINLHKQKHEFQVETGPILMPDKDIGGTMNIENMNIAYIAFNRFDSADVVLFSHHQISDSQNRSDVVRFFSDVQTLNTHTEVFSCDGAN